MRRRRAPPRHDHPAIPWDHDVGDAQLASAPAYFGAKPVDVWNGAQSSLGDAEYLVRLINTAPGAPIPALMQVYVAPAAGQEFVEIISRSAAAGTPRAAYGVDEGTPGRAQTTQTALHMRDFQGAVQDAFPSEKIRLVATG